MSLTYPTPATSAQPEMVRTPLLPLVGEVKELVIAELFERLAGEGFPEVRPGHGCVFRFIDADGSRLTKLADQAQMSKQSVGEVVADLERLGYVERAPDPGDRRAKTIRLTARGIEAQRAALSVFADIEQRWADEYGSKRVADMRQLLEAILADAPR